MTGVVAVNCCARSAAGTEATAGVSVATAAEVATSGAGIVVGVAGPGPGVVLAGVTGGARCPSRRRMSGVAAE